MSGVSGIGLMVKPGSDVIAHFRPRSHVKRAKLRSLRIIQSIRYL